MAQIKIRRKPATKWWPFLLVLLVPLVWYLLRVRDQRSERAATDVVRDTGTAPVQVALPPEAMPKPSDTASTMHITSPLPDTARGSRGGAAKGGAAGTTPAAPKGAAQGKTPKRGGGHD